MHSNNKITENQQQRIKKHAKKSTPHAFLQLLDSPQIREAIAELLPEHRQRLFPPTQTLSMFLSQALSPDRSCQAIVNQVAINNIITEEVAQSSATGGYCKARKRLPLTMVAELVRLTAKLVDDNVPQQWRWQNRPVRIVDGTTVTMADTSENQAAYPQQTTQKQGLGFPISRIVGITCLSSGAMLNAAMGPYKGKGGSEHGLLRSLLDTFQDGDIMLGDALYSSYFLLAECQARNVDVLFEQNGSRRLSTDFRTGKKLGRKDHLITLKKPHKCPDWMDSSEYEAAPNSLTIREVYVGHKILITSLLDANDYCAEMLKALYKSRWHVELDIRDIKTTLGMETLSCKTPEMAEKEMWVYFLSYNLIRIVMAESALLADVLPRQLSFKHALQVWRVFQQQSVSLAEVDKVDLILKLVGQKKVGKRPGRVEPRAVKRRPKPFSLLMKSRHECQAEILKKGHPKKVK